MTTKLVNLCELKVAVLKSELEERELELRGQRHCSDRGYEMQSCKQIMILTAPCFRRPVAPPILVRCLIIEKEVK